MFERIGSRVTIRSGTASNTGLVTVNVTKDKKGEHFTMTVNPALKDEEIDIQVLDTDQKLKQMLLLISGPSLIEDRSSVHTWPRRIMYQYSNHNLNRRKERLLVGHDEMHWFVAGVTASTTIKQAFAMLRPQAVTRVMHEAGVKDKDWRKRKTKGFVRQGEWFFVPVDFTPGKDTIIHKHEPISRQGGKPHMVSELIRMRGGMVVYTNSQGRVISEKDYMGLPSISKSMWQQRVAGARVLAKGKVTHPDHHTVELKTWHEVHLSTERGSSANAFID
jgi:hypothetical protein